METFHYKQYKHPMRNHKYLYKQNKTKQRNTEMLGDWRCFLLPKTIFLSLTILSMLPRFLVSADAWVIGGWHHNQGNNQGYGCGRHKLPQQ